jgi:hypothetical protein
MLELALELALELLQQPQVFTIEGPLTYALRLGSLPELQDGWQQQVREQVGTPFTR